MLYIGSHQKKKRCLSKAESEIREDFIVDYADVEVEAPIMQSGSH